MNFDEQMKQLQRESQKQSIQPGLYIQNPILNSSSICLMLKVY